MTDAEITELARLVEVARNPPQRTRSSLGLGCLVLILVGFAVVATSNRNKPNPNAPQNGTTDDAQARGPKNTPKTKTSATKPKDPLPIDPEPKESGPSLVSIAPLPRVIDFAVPPAEATYVTDWVRIAGYETRVTGVLVGPAPLQDRLGNSFWTPEPVLRVWVETRAVVATTGGLRRWASTLGPAVLTGSTGTTIPRPSSVSGATVRGEVTTTHKLVPGGPAVPDVLTFEEPGTTAGSLVLTLDAEHLDERGKFRHVIREEAWKKPKP